MDVRNDRRRPLGLRSNRVRRRVLGILVFASLNFSPAVAQLFQVGGGASSLLQASGGTVGIRAANYEGLLGAGILDGQWRMGGLLRRRWAHITLALGG